MTRMYTLGSNIVFDTLKRQIVSDLFSVNVGGREAVILQFLLENVNKVISKDDIQEKAWGSIYVSETSLTKAISNLRKSFAQFDGLTCEIKTISKEGYILILDEGIINNLLQESTPSFDVKNVVNSEKLGYIIKPSSSGMAESNLSFMGINFILICFSSALLSAALVAGVVIFLTKVI